MSAKANAPIIIKRKKVVVGGGHHGGAWKVAYADFVTAMMAFFMLLWMLNATTETQRKGLADYFTPTVAISRISGGGDGVFGGQDFFSEDMVILETLGTEEGADASGPSNEDEADAASAAAEVAALQQVEEILLGIGGESALSEQEMRHVVTRLTDEGLTIELFALPGAPLFDRRSAEPLPITRQMLAVIARVSGIVPNPVAIGAHVAAQPIVLRNDPIWDMTAARAEAVRRTMIEAELDPARVRRVTGFGDRVPSSVVPPDVRNNRIEITLLREVK